MTGGPHGTEASRGRRRPSHIILSAFVGWSSSLDKKLGQICGIPVFPATFVGSLLQQGQGPWLSDAVHSRLLTLPFPIIHLACRDELQG